MARASSIRSEAVTRLRDAGIGPPETQCPPAGPVVLWLLLFCAIYEIVRFIRDHYRM